MEMEGGSGREVRDEKREGGRGGRDQDRWEK